jgi:hypothetical protein
MGSSFALHGNETKAAVSLNTMLGISAQAAEQPRMELKSALEQRKLTPLTPYKADAWDYELRSAGILDRFVKIPQGLRLGFKIDFPSISNVQTPPNRDSVTEFSIEFNVIIQKELDKGRYLGPFTAKALEELIGPFQSSPMSIIPKPAKRGKFRLIQNFSYPHSPSVIHPNPSVNSNIDAQSFPTTWGKFSIVYNLIANLPPGSEAATRDVAEAYRTIPLHSSQWPAGVVRVSSTHFCIDTCTAFGATPSAGVYGHMADAGAEVFRNNGIGPLDKWVDDHLFIRIKCIFLAQYNEWRKNWNLTFARSGMRQTGGRIWFGEQCLETGKLEEANENRSKPIKDLSNDSPRSEHDKSFTYNARDIDVLSEKLGVIWEPLKDQPFAPSTTYTGFDWNVQVKTVQLSESKVNKYLAAIHKWRKRHAHVLQDVQELYGKLLHACEALPRGRTYLTSLEAMLSLCGEKPFLPHRAGEKVADDLNWWSDILQTGGVAQGIYPALKLKNPFAFSDASSGIGIGIVVGEHWRAWRLIPGWKTLNGKRDIGWAEAVGFELLTYTLATLLNDNGHVIVHGDNTGVVEGWWKRKHRNNEVNRVFRRINEFIHNLTYTFDVVTAYVPSASNPADKPSRGVHGPKSLLLPPIGIPEDLKPFIIDATEPLSTTEIRLLHNGSYSAPAAKLINSQFIRQQASERARANREEEEGFISRALLEG